MVQVKICGLTRRQDVVAAESAGAAFGGVILAPGSPRTVAPSHVAEIFRGSSLDRCGVFVDESRDRILELVSELALSVVQLHGDEPPEWAAELRASSGVTVWKAIRPRSGEEFVAAAQSYGGAVDGLLLDGWSAAGRGGTGARFPWSAIAPHRMALADLALIAAGGLTPRNVAEAVARLTPEVVDVSSGVERAPGIKDERLIRSFITTASREPAKRSAPGRARTS
ncbi:MAG: phosphoribosylanthranilate isomerase [Gemmatimonadota bacterium]